MVVISLDVMCYFLFLARSDMLPVLVISKLPEYLKRSIGGDDGEHTLILWNLWDMASCVIYFSVGVGKYYVLAKCTFLKQEDSVAKTLANITVTASRDAEKKTHPDEEMIALFSNTFDNDLKKGLMSS